MAWSPTVISGAVGEKSSGKPAPNRPDDVTKVQSLLKKVLASKAPAMKDGVCDDAMKGAIAAFQKLWGSSADSTVDPNGQTLRRLDRLANPLVLKPVSMRSVANGGYAIAFATCDGGSLPGPQSGYTRHLCLSDQSTSIDVTDRPASALLGKENAGALLNVFEKLNCWATAVQCRLQVRHLGAVISTSDPQVLKAPVQPHNGRMLPLDETPDNGPKLLYEGNPATDDFHGRMFAQVAGYDKYVFVWAGRFETDPAYRGFDCITYAGTTCGASVFHMADSADLCASLNTTPVELTRKVKDPKTGKETSVAVPLDDADPAHVKEFFAAAPPGYFLMYSGGHIVIVANCRVYEFKASTPSGYACTDVAIWLAPYKKTRLTLRRLPAKPARAV